jgi:hypothetical protein
MIGARAFARRSIPINGTPAPKRRFMWEANEYARTFRVLSNWFHAAICSPLRNAVYGMFGLTSLPTQSTAPDRGS